MKDLWPDNINTVDASAPVRIIRHQASCLSEKTRGLVHGDVKQHSDDGSWGSRYPFEWSFCLVAPALNNYTYRLFTIRHDFGLYPVKFDIDRDVIHEIAPDSEQQIEADSEDDLVETLEQIFRSAKTQQIIHAMIAQTDEEPNA